jgi:hypothetical protein
MALPTTRNKSYAIGDAVRAADLNDLQDQVIALAHPAPRPRHISPLAGAYGPASVSSQFAVALGTAFLGSLTDLFGVPIELVQGERITQVQARVKPAGSADQGTMKLYRTESTVFSGQTRTQVGATQTTATGSTNTQLLTLSGLTELAAAQHFNWYLEFDLTVQITSGLTIESILVWTDFP